MESPGPGDFDPDRAKNLTHYRSPEVHIDPESPQRPASFADPNHVGTAGPGQYTSGK